MIDKDSFVTFKYTNHYINTCYNRDKNREEIQTNINGNIKKHNTIIRAKRYINNENKLTL